MMSDLRNEAQVFRSVVAPCVRAFAKTIPFLYIRGNHEARGYFARMLMDYFPTDSQRFYYSFDHGPVHFILLDCGEDKSDSSKEYSGLVDFDRYRDQETEWLKADLRSDTSRKARFRIVFVHMPPTLYASNQEQRHGTEYVKNKWAPLLNAGKIDVMISGHTHRYAIVKPKEGEWNFPIVVGSVDTILRADVSPRQINVTVAKNDGAEFDRLTMLKKQRSPRWPSWLGGPGH
jgi:UDP-2,3-diacylglucosamine pyrophosphatase LpxH